MRSDSLILVSNQEKKIRSYKERQQILQQDHQNLQNDYNNFKRKMLDYQDEMKNKQNTKRDLWIDQTLKHFKRANQLVISCILQIEKIFSIEIPSEDNYSPKNLLNIVMLIAHEQMINLTYTTILPSDDIIQRIEYIRNEIFNLLNDISNHASILIDKDPFYMFIFYYNDLMRISLISLINSISNWMKSSKFLQTGQMKNYVNERKKEIFCDLNTWTFIKCQEFLSNIRNENDLDGIEEQAINIIKRIRCDLSYFDSIFTIEQSEFLRRSLHEFSTFYFEITYYWMSLYAFTNMVHVNQLKI